MSQRPKTVLTRTCLTASSSARLTVCGPCLIASSTFITFVLVGRFGDPSDRFPPGTCTLPGPSSALSSAGPRPAAREQRHHRTGFDAIRVAGNRRRRLPRDDVVRRVEGRVDPAPPRTPALQGRQLEAERLP